jgi:outer membrane lipoprotein-sorting protein
MDKVRVATALLAATVLVGAAGCFRSTRLVTKTMAPDVYRSEAVEGLESDLQVRDAAIKTLNAAVLITASEGGHKEGQVTTYTSFRGYIFVRKPSDLRVILQLPVIGSRAMDMVSNGQTFKLLIPPKSKAIEGSNTVTTPSKNGLENLRPNVFLDSLLVPGVGPEEEVAVTNSTRIVPSATKKRVDLEEPDYDVTVLKRTGAKNVLQTVRVIHISRTNMLPYQQDIYDDQGRVVTQALYDKYAEVNGIEFPMLIVMNRPLDEYSLKVEVSKLTLNEQLEDDQFELKIPAGIAVQEMK